MSKKICEHCQLSEFDALMALLGYGLLVCGLFTATWFAARLAVMLISKSCQ